MRKRLRYISIVFLVIVILFIVQTVISNPYFNNFYPTPFVAAIQGGKVTLTQVEPVYVINNPVITMLRYADAGIRIAAIDSEHAFIGSVSNIIAQIHTERFNPQKPYLISGGHFSDQYVRNLGIFYGSMLDGCIPTSEQDFAKREITTTQSVALSLKLLNYVNVEPTTFTPVFPNVYAPTNVYTRASDSLYGVLFTLEAMRDTSATEWMYSSTFSCYTLQTQEVGRELLMQNKVNLTRLVAQYKNTALDQKTGLIKKDITLASARDGVKRESSFYDNVIAWATLRLAGQLGLVSISNTELTEWKNRIIAAFWDEKNGLFINDLSQESLRNHTFSGDAFIVLSTRFFDISNTEDKRKLTKMISYVQNQKLDKPFPLRYSVQNPVENEYFFVRVAAPSYMGDAIWSHWGMEYVKALILTGQRNTAKEFLDIYTQKIKEYGGYPEVYDTNGNILHTALYKSLLHTGWVINYEEAKGLLTTANKAQ